MGEHAILSASSSSRWLNCPGSVALCEGLPDNGSEAADWGTACHEVASWCLTGDCNAEAFRGRKVAGGNRFFTVGDDEIEMVQTYVDIVREYVANTGGRLLVEQRVDYSAVLGVPNQFGTSDAIILADKALIVIDLKTGRGEEVDALNNTQLRLYGLGALEDFGLVSDFETFTGVIVQPRISSRPLEESCSIDQLHEFGRHAAQRAQTAMLCRSGAVDPLENLRAGEKQCRWCKVKAICPAARAAVTETVVGGGPASDEDFVNLDGCGADAITADTDVDYLAAAWANLDFIESWVKAVKAEVYLRTDAGTFPGYKMVAGKRGARAWNDAEEAEKLLKSMRLKQDEMYEFTLISPAKAEKVLKENPRKWAKLAPLIGQSEGKPTVVPDSDKRPALKPKVDDTDFTDIETADVNDINEFI